MSSTNKTATNKTATNRTALSRVFLPMAAAAFASMAAQRTCDPILHPMALDFGVDEAAAGWSIGVFAFAYGVAQIFYGPLADRYGKLQVAALAAMACGLANVATAIAPSLELLLVGRALAGATAAAVIPQCMAWIGDNVSYEERQETLARFLLGTVFGTVAGQALSGVFADYWTWRASFWLLAALFIGSGMILWTAGLDKPAAGAGRLSFAASLRGVLSAPWARVVLWVVLAEGALVFGVVAYTPAYLIERFGVSPTIAGASAAVFGLGGMVFLAAAKRLLARLGEHGLALTGGLALAASFLILLATPDWRAAPPAALLAGFGFYMLHNTLQTHATQMVPAMRGAAVAMFASGLFFGQSLGAAVGGWFTDAHVFRWLLALAAAGVAALGWRFGLAIKARAGAAAPTA